MKTWKTIVILNLLLLCVSPIVTANSKTCRLPSGQAGVYNHRHICTICKPHQYFDYVLGQCRRCSGHLTNKSSNVRDKCFEYRETTTKQRPPILHKTTSKTTSEIDEKMFCKPGHYFDRSNAQCQPCLGHFTNHEANRFDKCYDMVTQGMMTHAATTTIANEAAKTGVIEVLCDSNHYYDISLKKCVICRGQLTNHEPNKRDKCSDVIPESIMTETNRVARTHKYMKIRIAPTNFETKHNEDYDHSTIGNKQLTTSGSKGLSHSWRCWVLLTSFVMLLLAM